MDYVYTCRNSENEELLYSLRCLEENMPNGRVWLVGYRPKWYVGDFVSVKDVGNKFDNIRQCIKKITEIDEISDNFVLMNDDFFALKKINKIESFHGGLLSNKITRYKESRMSWKYIKLLELTLKDLQNNGINKPLDYDIHLPMIMNKELLAQTIDKAYFPRSGYGNIVKIDGIETQDVKIYKSKNKLVKNETGLISTETNSFQSLKNKIFKNNFYLSSSYEDSKYVDF